MEKYHNLIRHEYLNILYNSFISNNIRLVLLWGQEEPPLSDRFYNLNPRISYCETSKLRLNISTGRFVNFVNDGLKRDYYFTYKLAHENKHDEDFRNNWFESGAYKVFSKIIFG